MKTFEKALHAFIEAQDIPATRLKEAIQYTLFPGGKRFRPQLVFATGAVFEIPEAKLIPIAIAIECMHTYTLVHDDLPAMDNDDLRRNRPTCHKAFDEATAILVGDALQSLSLLALTSLEVAKILLEASGPSGMLSGQSLDLSELSKEIDIALLEKIHHLKTTTLIQAAIAMPLTLSSCTPQEKEALLSFGKHLGLAFQMRDDYLDLYSPESLGKGKSSDQENAKQTFAAFYGQSELRDLIQHTLSQARENLALFGEHGAALAQLTQFHL